MSYTFSKEDILKKCKDIATSKVQQFEARIAEIKTSTGAETKSTAGDKHETGRAMMQLEEEKAQHQLAVAQSNLAQIISIKALSMGEIKTVRQAALVQLNTGVFFISVPLGKIELHDQSVYCLSWEAPIVQAMKGLKKGDRFAFNDRSFTILEVD